MDLETMLKKAKTVIQQREAVHEQQVTIKGDRLEAPQLLEAVGQMNQAGTKADKLTSIEVTYSMWQGSTSTECLPSKEATCRNARRKAILL